MRLVTLLPLLVLLTACVEPFRPEFQIEDGFFLLEGQIAAGPITSEVRLRRSDFGESALTFEQIDDAVVYSETDEGRREDWATTGGFGRYRPSASFTPRTGEVWRIVAELPDGQRLLSNFDTIPGPVPLRDFHLAFEGEALIDADGNGFEPGFTIFVDYDDPAETSDFYRWTYRSYEEVDVCVTCESALFRDGRCDNTVRQFNGFFPIGRIDYLCDVPECYAFRDGPEIVIGDDRLSNGSEVSNRRIGTVPYRKLGGLLVEARMEVINRAYLDYLTVVSDLVNGNSGLNPTIPAALNGNLRNADPEGAEVLGYVAAVSVDTAQTFLVRTSERYGLPPSLPRELRLEPLPPLVELPRAPCNGPNRSPQRPPGWPD